MRRGTSTCASTGEGERSEFENSTFQLHQLSSSSVRFVCISSGESSTSTSTYSKFRACQTRGKRRTLPSVCFDCMEDSQVQPRSVAALPGRRRQSQGTNIEDDAAERHRQTSRLVEWFLLTGSSSVCFLGRSCVSASCSRRSSPAPFS